jgi:hypothetical protein
VCGRQILLNLLICARAPILLNLLISRGRQQSLVNLLGGNFNEFNDKIATHTNKTSLATRQIQ